MSEARAWVDGRLVDAGAPVLPVLDRGFQLGDGIFETIRVRRGVAIDLALHLGRLRDGLEILGFTVTWSDEALAAAIAETVRANAPDDAAVRITVSRGAPTARGLLPSGWQDLVATVVIQAWPHVPPPAVLLERGVRAITSTLRRDPTSPLAAIKTTSRADHVVAKLEAERAGVDDALVRTLDGDIAEATTANLAMVVPGSGGPLLLTPPLTAGILDGTTRDWLLSPDGAQALGLTAREERIFPDAFAAADEALLLSSVAGFLPLVELDGRPVGDGRPGPWGRRLREAREAWIRARAGG